MFSIVFVCSGNRFRSPLAEAFVRRLTDGLPVAVGSFGTLELGSVPPLGEALEIGVACGIPISDHLTRHLGAEGLDQIDLLLGFEHEHVRHAVIDAGAPRNRSFTLREFIRLTEDVDPADDEAEPVARARAVVAHVSRLRGASGQRTADEIPDPFGRPWSAYRASAEEVRALSIALVERLFGVSAPREFPTVPRRRHRSWTNFGRR